MRKIWFFILSILLTLFCAFIPMVAFAAETAPTDFKSIFGTILLAIALPVAAIIGKLLATLIKKGISKIDNSIAQQLSWQAVVWAENTLKTSTGSEKFQKAYEWMAAKMPGMNKEDIEKFIETALAEMDKNLK
jgi:hypothetical protein